MKLLIASGNAGKVVEFRALLAKDVARDLELVGIGDPSLNKIKPPDVPENGDTYFENALIKAVKYHALYRLPVLADDSGLEVDALGGRPGVHSAIYGGSGLDFPQRCQKILEELKPHSPLRWTARFRCVLCYWEGHNGVPLFFQGTTEGKIAPAPAGKNGFGYDPIFYSTELGLTFGEADTATKDRISHRAEAVRSFLKWWELDRT